ncbi:hypothetical protein WR25_13397 [Diploscapter pachys]|uniref:Sema domain-containing protein n=1 Tax=Diploscapter pachys TaxID=2018661 RepID=A0A2A2J3M5_9BILA|nr:hypothetical protein WR25_13397 [Diploscapter pachys]
MNPFILLLSCLLFSLVKCVFVRNPDNSFSRGPLDYRNLLLDAKSASLYVGARGRLFRLWVYNINDTTENLYTERIIPVSESDLSDCVSEGSSDEECQFSSRFMAFQDKKQSIYVCSSVAMKPEIRVLDASTLKDKQASRTEIGICAPDSHVNATAVVVEWGNPDDYTTVYSGIRTGMAGENHLIYRPALSEKGKETYQSMRTIYSDTQWLNEPQFVGAFDVGEHVFFFFREIAHETVMGERTVHSRVARICKRDTGGRAVFRQVWTSFVKARLNCSISAQLPFYFDNIQAITRVDTTDDTLFYAAMSTSDTAFVTSAICAFSLKQINQLFDHGLFMETSPAGWMPRPADAVPKHRPGTCTANSQALSDSDINFARNNLLMAEPVPGGTPIMPTRDVVFSHILVDPKTEQNVIFMLDGGSHRLWKISHWRADTEWKWQLIESTGLNLQSSVRAVAILPGEFLYTATDEAISQFSLSSCQRHISCALCAVDPYCSWNAAQLSCRAREKSHSQSVGWISSWAGRGAGECVGAERTQERKAYPGDSLKLDGIEGGAWKTAGKRIIPNDRQIIDSNNNLILLNLEEKHSGVYELERNGHVVIKYRLDISGAECARPLTVEAYKSCQREWCKRADDYKTQIKEWQEAKKRSNAMTLIFDGPTLIYAGTLILLILIMLGILIHRQIVRMRNNSVRKPPAVALSSTVPKKRRLEYEAQLNNVQNLRATYKPKLTDCETIRVHEGKPYVHRMIAVEEVALEIDMLLERIDSSLCRNPNESTLAYLQRVRQRIPSLDDNLIQRIAFLQESARHRGERFDLEKLMELRSYIKQFIKKVCDDGESSLFGEMEPPSRNLVATLYDRIHPNSASSRRRRTKFGGSDGGRLLANTLREEQVPLLPLPTIASASSIGLSRSTHQTPRQSTSLIRRPDRNSGSGRRQSDSQRELLLGNSSQ